ncbi:hypothetical protein NL676_029386 [Syzygium grande]|nr:hypothetical protein NL676_029386 [Syzygium grande]
MMVVVAVVVVDVLIGIGETLARTRSAGPVSLSGPLFTVRDAHGIRVEPCRRGGERRRRLVLFGNRAMFRLEREREIADRRRVDVVHCARRPPFKVEMINGCVQGRGSCP